MQGDDADLWFSQAGPTFPEFPSLCVWPPENPAGDLESKGDTMLAYTEGLSGALGRFTVAGLLAHA